jgi:hypothetical protein
MEYSRSVARPIATGSEPVYAYPEFRDGGPRMIAAIVASAVYPGQGKSEIKKSDLGEMRRLLEKPEELARRGVSPNLHAGLAKQLDTLELYLDSDRGGFAIKAERPPPSPFCHAFKADALFAEDLRTCAKAVIECLGEKATEHLTIGEYLKMSAIYRHLEAGTEPDSQEAKDRLGRLQGQIDGGFITRETFNLLHTIFNDESAARAAMQHGPVKIGEREFQHVYRLDTEGLKLDDKDPDEIKSFILRHWEAEGKALHGSFYDRIYVEHGGDLFLLLHERGTITKGRDAIPDDAAVAMRKNGRLDGVGRVVHRQEAVNTPKEALLKTLTDARDFFKGNDELKELIEAEARHNQKETKGEAHSGLIKMLITVMVGMPVINTLELWGLAGLGALGLLATGRNLYNYVRADHDPFKMKPIYHAIGVGLSVDVPAGKK